MTTDLDPTIDCGVQLGGPVRRDDSRERLAEKHKHLIEMKDARNLRSF